MMKRLDAQTAIYVLNMQLKCVHTLELVFSNMMYKRLRSIARGPDNFQQRVCCMALKLEVQSYC